MTDIEKKLVAALLNTASDEFSCNGCNEYYIAGLIPNVEDRRALVKAMHEDNGDPENYDPTQEYVYVEDWWLMAYLADRVLAE